MKIHYMGVREPLKKILEDKAAELHDYPLQIVDLGGSIKYESDSFINSFDLDAETIILSNRRYNLNDELGCVETELLQKYKKSILYRTSPLDIGIELYRGWASSHRNTAHCFFTDRRKLDFHSRCCVCMLNLKKRCKCSRRESL
ncbi:hypothetical protein ACO1C0_08835 [Bacillus velezensis]